MDPRIIGLALLPLIAVAAMWRLGALSDPHARAWQAISGVRAVANAKRRASLRFGALAWLALRLDLPLQLKRAGVRQSPSRFILHSAVYAAVVLGAVLLIDGIALTHAYEAPIPPLAGAVAGLAVGTLRFVELPRRVRRRRQAIDDAMTELMVPLAIVSANGAIANRKEALTLFSKALDDPTLARFIQIPEAYGEHRDEFAADYRSLVADPGNVDDVTIFREIGETYGSELFLALSQAEHQVKRQRPLREALRGIADQFQSRQIDEDEQWVELARTKVQVPMSAFVLLIFIAILVPTVVIILHAIGS
jgi:hypothetical protein